MQLFMFVQQMLPHRDKVLLENAMEFFLLGGWEELEEGEKREEEGGRGRRREVEREGRRGGRREKDEVHVQDRNILLTFISF